MLASNLTRMARMLTVAPQGAVQRVARAQRSRGNAPASQRDCHDDLSETLRPIAFEIHLISASATKTRRSSTAY